MRERLVKAGSRVLDAVLDIDGARANALVYSLFDRRFEREVWHLAAEFDRSRHRS